MVNPLNNKKELKKGLYLVSTPIGNLGDITYRAIETLKKSEYILCEDTRVSKVLLDKFGIKSKLISNHKFNEAKNIPKVIDLLKKEKIISLISDAGTPAISDPGSMLVNACQKNDIAIFPIPGPSAVTAAVSASGFCEKYFFYGFFPEKEKILKNDIEVLSNLNSCIVFFVSPKKINRTIPKIKKYFINREILICREISKYYEEYTRVMIDKLETFKIEPKGELTIVISGNKMDKKVSHYLSESDKRNIKKMIKKLTIKEIINLIGQNSKVSKKEIYNYCLKIKNEK